MLLLPYIPLYNGKAVNSAIFKILQTLKETLFTDLLPCPSARVPVTNSRRQGTAEHLAWALTECSW